VTLKLGFLASGNGSSARAIVQAIGEGRLDAQAALMVSNRAEAGALAFAREEGIAVVCLPTKTDPEGADARLTDELVRNGVDIIVLSGYLRKLGPQVQARYAGRILNIHPSLLPAFGGHGMYGRRVHEAVVLAGVSESGATIHLADGDYDTGAVLAQRSVAVAADDTAETLEARITAMEPGFFVETLQRIVAGEIKLP
jgi:phosphoribosylglycinamide formyltransferase-1